MPSKMQRVVTKYLQLYKQLYNREPKDIRVIDEEFVIVNDTQIRLADLEMLTQQLEQEYQSIQNKHRSVVKRLINWFRQS